MSSGPLGSDNALAGQDLARAASRAALLGEVKGRSPFVVGGRVSEVFSTCPSVSHACSELLASMSQAESSLLF